VAAPETRNDQPSKPENLIPSESRRYSLLGWLWPVPIGLVFGTIVLAHFAGKTPSDPFGQQIGAGMGGVLGLVFAILLRALRRA
jgi:hypothetical protein